MCDNKSETAMDTNPSNLELNDSSRNLSKDVVSFTEATTMHGLRYLTSPGIHLLKKVIWVLILLAMVIGLCISIKDSIDTYYRYESVVSTKIKRNNSLPYPAVSVCNFNQAKASAFASHWPELMQFGEWASNLLNGISLPEASENQTRILNMLKTMKVRPVVEKTTPSFQETFVECTIGISPKICAQYISFFLTDNLICYTFNSDEFVTRNGLMQANLPGSVYGLKFVLDINPDDYLVSSFLGKGMQVLVHHPYQYPRLNLKRFVIEAGKEYFVSLKLQQNIILPTPYSTVDCIPESELNGQV